MKEMPTPQHHFEAFIRDIFPTAAEKATPLIAAAGGAAVAFPDFWQSFDAAIPRIIGVLTVSWLLTQIYWAWRKGLRKAQD